MKKFLVAMGLVAFAVVGCDDSSSASAGSNDEPGVESSSSIERGSSSSEKAKSSSSDTQGDAKHSSSSEKDKSSSSSKDIGSSCSTESDGVSSSSGKSSSFNTGEDKSVYDAAKNTLTDLRDGRTYRTTTIEIFDAERGIDYSEVWMAENLNYATDNSYCYDDYPDCCAMYGRLYTWTVAVGKTEDECGNGYECNLPVGNIRGVCPQGWYLPSKEEWQALVVAVDAGITEFSNSNVAGWALKAMTGWIAYSGAFVEAYAYSFAALPAGYRLINESYGEGRETTFWSSTEDNSTDAYSMHLRYNGSDAYLGNCSKNFGFSVRCVKD